VVCMMLFSPCFNIAGSSTEAKPGQATAVNVSSISMVRKW
jgi:hypothetical protein